MQEAIAQPTVLTRPAVASAAWASPRAKPLAILPGGILVHVPTRGEPDALRLAVELSQLSGAAVIGVGSEAFEPNLLNGLDWSPGSGLRKRVDAFHARLRDAEARFTAETAAISGRTSWFAEFQAPDLALMQHACGGDWILVVRPAPGEAPGRTPRISGLVQDAGVPVLLAPHGADPLQARRIVVGWRNSRATRRAIADAMPLLQRAEEVHLISIEPGEGGDDARDGLAEVRLRLRLRGCAVDAECGPLCWPGLGATLVQIAEDKRADLVVVGGFEHTPLLEWCFGSVSATLTGACPVWVLMSN